MHNEENQKDKEELKNKIPSIFALNEFFITKSSSVCVVVSSEVTGININPRNICFNKKN